MQLPDNVRSIAEERAAAVGFPALKRAAQLVSDAYREKSPERLNILSAAERAAAYLNTRMPATYAAAAAVLRQMPDCEIRSLLDVGAGAGAASLAAQSRFPNLEAITLIERDAGLAEVAREFLPMARMRRENFLRVSEFPPHDLVIAAYALGESLNPETLNRLWQAARVAFVVIEPGTPGGFALVRQIRDGLLNLGARMLAPCPGGAACPIREPDWCHFAARVERTSLHRRLKGGNLNYEDEKFSYVALAREDIGPAPRRIIRRPVHQSGLIVLESCGPNGLETLRIPKRERERFRQARRASWGDAFPL